MFASKNAWMCSPSPEKIGNADMSASVRVTSGTSASKVVKVRLEAICKQRSSLNLPSTCARKRPSCRSGKGMGSIYRGVNVAYDTSAVYTFAEERHPGSIAAYQHQAAPSPLRVDSL